MDEHKNNPRDPWDPGVYKTGRTRPPKSRGGLIAVLLIVVIFLSGLVSFLGIMNVRLFARLSQQPMNDGEPVSFVEDGDAAITFPEPAEPAPTQPLPTQPDTFTLAPSPQSVPNVLQEEGLSLQEIYERSIPSVVSISCQSRSGTGSGTGVVLTADGYLVTNNHVVEDAGIITVRLTDERSFRAELVGADAVSDLAVLHIEADDLTPAQFGDSSVLRVGDSVAAIGDPLGEEFRGTLTNGIVSAINRDVTTGGRTLTLIQTNAALNSGNSGGPLINCYGQVIGINTMKISTFIDDAGVEGLGFAIPSTTVKEITDQLISQGYVSGRPALGIRGEPLSTFYQYYYRLPAGIYITQVEPGSSAAELGIAPGDILLSIDGSRVTDMDQLQTLLYTYHAGETVEIIIYRGGREYAAGITLHESTS